MNRRACHKAVALPGDREFRARQRFFIFLLGQIALSND
jgi:hypothetical protein